MNEAVPSPVWHAPRVHLAREGNRMLRMIFEHGCRNGMVGLGIGDWEGAGWFVRRMHGGGASEQLAG